MSKRPPHKAQKAYKTARLYYPNALGRDTTITLNGNPHHYLRNVMRKNIGDGVRFFNAEHGEWLARITHIGKKSLDCDVIEALKPALKNDEASPCITLAISPLQKDRLDMVVEKACELGFHCFQPLIMDHTNTRKINQERITAQMIEASEQCERLSLPVVRPPLTLREWLTNMQEQGDSPIILAALEREDAKPIQDAITAALTERPKKQHNIHLLIGPEGGFSDAEKEMLRTHNGAYPVSLGNTILRAETAAIFGLSILRAALKPYAV